MIWDTAKAAFSAGKDLTLAKKLIISAEDTFPKVDSYQIAPGSSNRDADFCVSLFRFKRLVEDSRGKGPKHLDEALSIAKRLHSYAYSPAGIIILGKKLDAIWFESKYRAHPEVEVLHRFLEDVLLDISLPSDYGSPDSVNLAYKLTYSRLFPLSEKWRNYKHTG
jgi:hypothetical protein